VGLHIAARDALPLGVDHAEVILGAEAAVWYRRAADQGDSDAQFNMGDMCANGWGEPQD
jgi:TPR repeat protein